jgi:hypothetical protein
MGEYVTAAVPTVSARLGTKLDANMTPLTVSENGCVAMAPTESVTVIT